MLELGLSCFSDSYNTDGNSYRDNVSARRRLLRVRVGKRQKSAVRTSAGFLFPSFWLILFFISISEAQQQKEQQRKDENKRRTRKQRYKDELLIHRVSGHH